MEDWSSRRVRTLVTQMAGRGLSDRMREGKAAQQIDHNIIDNREISEFAELTAMLKERVFHAPIDDKPRTERDTLN